MGKVEENKLKKEVYKAACDKRCTHARGPICWCKCHCENHGTGRVVKVVIINELPKVEFNDEKALQRSKEYTAALEQAIALVELRGPKDMFRHGNLALIAKAQKARQHKSRMKALKLVIGAV